jgi:glycosyltransferase involved in cell wall biosynthesis
MKIVNICISNPYIEGFAYQENILTDYFKNAGIETVIIAANVLPKYLKKEKTDTGTNYENEKKIIRIKCLKITTEFLITFGLFNQLKKEKPDVIFHHNLNSSSLLVSILYRILNKNVIFLVDNHADYLNRNKNKLWQLLYYKFLVRISAKLVSPFVNKFYGVTLLRCDYLNEVYGIKKHKLDFLPIGADTITSNKITETKFELKQKFNIPEYSFIFVSGGKMGKKKGTDKLIKAVDEINNQHQNVLLVLFGSFQDTETQDLAEGSKNTIFKGWCNHETSLKLLKLADVAVWPIHHTTLIEDAISVNTPLILKKNRTTEHLINGNGIFLYTDEYIELVKAMNHFIENYSSKKYIIHCNTMRENLNYEVISKKIIDDVSRFQKETK